LRGIDGASWNIERPALVAFAFQLSKHSVEAHSVEPKRIFKQDESGLCFVNNSQSLRPEPAVIFRAKSLPGKTAWLARWTSENSPDTSVAGCVERVRVFLDRAGPVCFEEVSAGGI
jgi:hypothetical protein